VVLLCVTESCVLPWRVCFWFNIGIVLEFQVILQCNLYRAVIVISFIVINTLLFVSLDSYCNNHMFYKCITVHVRFQSFC